MIRYTVVVMASAMLEALSMQNDNLFLPLYMWSLSVLADVVV
jgi:dolichol kinase